MLLLLAHLVVSVASLPYAPVPLMPAAPSPYGTPLNGALGPQPSNIFPPAPPQTISPGFNVASTLSTATYPPSTTTTGVFSAQTASPPPPQPPQTFDEFNSNVGELDLNWNQLLDSTTATSTTEVFVPSHNNIANVLTGGSEANFIDKLPQWSENVTTSTLETLQRIPDADENQ